VITIWECARCVVRAGRGLAGWLSMFSGRPSTSLPGKLAHNSCSYCWAVEQGLTRPATRAAWLVGYRVMCTAIARSIRSRPHGKSVHTAAKTRCPSSKVSLSIEQATCQPWWDRSSTQCLQNVMWRSTTSSDPTSGLDRKDCTARAVARRAAYVYNTYVPSRWLRAAQWQAGVGGV
jgi:hypothetical protein